MKESKRKLIIKTSDKENGRMNERYGWLDQCTGVRPVVEMVDNVYIVSGDGTEKIHMY